MTFAGRRQVADEIVSPHDHGCLQVAAATALGYRLISIAAGRGTLGEMSTLRRINNSSDKNITEVFVARNLMNQY